MQGMTGKVTVLSCLILAGCLGRPDAPPPVRAGSYTLPFAQPAMLYMSSRDLDRPLIIEATQHRNEETSTPDGRLLEKASLSVLRQIFQTVETNQPAIRPKIILKVQGSANFSRRDRMMKIACTLDAYQPDGTVIGSYFGRYDGADPVEYKEALQPGYQNCLTKAAGDMLNSPSFARTQQAGFPAPLPAAYKSFLESLGLKP